MSARFRAIPFAWQDEAPGLEALAPYSPLNTSAYAAARARKGHEVFLLGTFSGGSLTSGCVGILASGRLTTSLEIPSMPSPPDPQLFWAGLSSFCDERGITELELQSFGSRPEEVPELGKVLSRKQRREYLMDLSGGEICGSLPSNHRRNVRRAEKAGLTIDRTEDPAEAETHVQLQNESMTRRRSRGETVRLLEEAEEASEFLRSGAGVLYRASDGDQVMSSILLLRSPRVAYYQSAGTSPDGMRTGASAFLICSVARALAEDGFGEFNLGGANPENAGLTRFKNGFASHTIDLEAVTFGTGPAWRRKLATAAKGVLGAARR